MNRKILEAERKRFNEIVETQGKRIEECTSKRAELTKMLDEINRGGDIRIVKDYLFDIETEKKLVLQKEIRKQKERNALASKNIPGLYAKYKENPKNVLSKNAYVRAEFDKENSKAIMDSEAEKLEKIEEKMEEIREMTLDDLLGVLEKKISYQDSIATNAKNVIDFETERFQREEKTLLKEEKSIKKRGVYVQDPDIEKHQVDIALQSSVRKRIASIPTIDEKTIRMCSKMIRATHEKGVDRAEFLIKCRLWESENEKESDDERYYETSEAMRVLGSWIATNGEDPSSYGDERFKGDPTELKQLFLLSMELIKSKLFLPEEKFDLAVSFFTINAFEYCYDMFLEMLRSPHVRAPEKAEACKFLYYSENEEYLPEIEKYTLEIINNTELEDRFRYETIACYITELGLKTRYLNSILKTNNIDQELVTNLFKVFIKTPTHPDYLILAYTFLLEQSHDEKVKPEIEKKLLDMAKSTTFDKLVDKYMQEQIRKETYGMDEKEKKEFLQKVKEGKFVLDIFDEKKLAEKIHRIRADAADVLVRRTSSPYHKEAYELVISLGESEEDLEINRTVYTNAENVHLLNEKCTEYIETIFQKSNKRFVKIDEVVRDIEIMCEKFQLNVDDCMSVRRSLDRLMMDASKFTRFNITMTTILLCIYNEICNHASKKRLMARLLEELIDMSDTCASGHAKRLVNTMVGYVDELEGMMDINLQLEANIKARINTAIKNLEEGDQKNAIMDAMVVDAKDRSPYLTFIDKAFNGGIVQDLKDEFVVQGFISENKFKEICDEVLSKL